MLTSKRRHPSGICAQGCAQVVEAYPWVPSLVAGVDGVTGGELPGRRRRRARWGFHLQWLLIKIEHGDGFVDSLGFYW